MYKELLRCISVNSCARFPILSKPWPPFEFLMGELALFKKILESNLLVYQSSHPGMTEMGENTAFPQSTTNDRVSNKICYVYMNLFTKMILK